MFVPVRITAGGKGTQYERSIDLTGERLLAFEAHAGNMTEPLTTIGKSLVDIVAGQFAGQGAGGAGGTWKPLSEHYGAWKERKVPGLPLLVGIHKTGGTRPHTEYARSGAMKRALLDPLSLHVTERRMLYAPDSDIAGFHELGTTKMPARPPVDLRLTDLRVFDRVFVAWLAKLVKESRL